MRMQRSTPMAVVVASLKNMQLQTILPPSLLKTRVFIQQQTMILNTNSYSINALPNVAAVTLIVILKSPMTPILLQRWHGGKSTRIYISNWQRWQGMSWLFQPLDVLSKGNSVYLGGLQHGRGTD